MLNFLFNPVCKNFIDKKINNMYEMKYKNKMPTKHEKKSHAYLLSLFVFFTGLLIKEFSENTVRLIFPYNSNAKFEKKNLYQKLAQIPVFSVTNSAGQPYITNGSKEEQIGLIFFSHEDALALLKAMQNSRQVSDARIYIMGLDKAYKMVTRDVNSNDTKVHQEQELKIVFRFYPNQKEVKNAEQILNKNKKSQHRVKNIPVFIADGLTVYKGKENIIPIFLTKKDLEKAWSKMISENPDINPEPVILVADLIKIIGLMEKNSKDHCKFGFFPSCESIEFVKKENKINPFAKIHISNKF